MTFFTIASPVRFPYIACLLTKVYGTDPVGDHLKSSLRTSGSTRLGRARTAACVALEVGRPGTSLTDRGTALLRYVPRKRPDFSLDPLPAGFFGDFQVVAGLNIDPERLAHAEKAG